MRAFKHGHWIRTEESIYGEPLYECSRCHVYHVGHHYPVCPDCKAIMDGPMVDNEPVPIEKRRRRK